MKIRRKADQARTTGPHTGSSNLEKGTIPEKGGHPTFPVKLHGADLTGRNFSDVDLTERYLWDANLRDADLRGARGLLSEQLAGADLTRAQLPVDLATFPALGHVESLSENAAKVFLTMLAVIAFTILTIASAQDVDIITNGASTELPVVGIKIPILGFYAAVPVLLLIFYLYLHLYLQRLWETLGTLPAIFPDGRRIDERTFPWLMNDLVRDYLPQLRSKRLPLARLQSFISNLLGWAVAPVVFWILWANSLRAQSHVLAFLHIVVLSISIGAAVWFWTLRRQTLMARRRGEHPIVWIRQLRGLAGAVIATVSAVVVGIFWTLGVLTTPEISHRWTVPGQITATMGWKSERAKRLSALGELLPGKAMTNLKFWQRWGPHLLLVVGIEFPLDLEDAILSVRPQDWTGRLEEVGKELPRVRGFQFKEKRLWHLHANRSFLANAHFTNVEMRYAEFRFADLRRVRLEYVHAEGVRFDWADFATRTARDSLATELSQEGKQRRFDGSDFENSSFNGATLEGAEMNSLRALFCSFDGVEFNRAVLESARFESCTFRNASFFGVRMTGASFHSLGIVTDFSGASFDHADCTGVVFEEAKFLKASYEGANLTNADLSGAVGVDPETLQRAFSLYGAKLPNEWSKTYPTAANSLETRLANDPH